MFLRTYNCLKRFIYNNMYKLLKGFPTINIKNKFYYVQFSFLILLFLIAISRTVPLVVKIVNP